MSISEPLSTAGTALLEAGRPLEAVEVLRRGVAAREPSAADLLVRAYLDSGSWHAAADWLEPLVAQGHTRFAGWLGVALAQIGDAERAEDALRLAVGSGEVAASNDLAILLRGQGRFEEAVALLVRAADAEDPQAAANLITMLYEAGDVRTANEMAQRYCDDARPDTLVALADVRAAQRRDDEAEDLYRRAGELGALRAHTAYGVFLLVARADGEAAEREFREAGRHEEPGWAYTLGRFLLDDGRPDEARGYLQLALDTGDQAAVDALAELDDEDLTDD
ncbi:MAG: tetratricopeptide repeat protein [Pseudonocardia sp.]